MSVIFARDGRIVSRRLYNSQLDSRLPLILKSSHTDSHSQPDYSNVITKLRRGRSRSAAPAQLRPSSRSLRNRSCSPGAQYSSRYSSRCQH